MTGHDPEKPSATRRLTVHVPLEGGAPASLKLAVYAFDASGNLVSSASVDKDRASLDVPVAQRVRLYVAPAVEGNRSPTLPTLERLRAYTPAVTINPHSEQITLRPITKPIWEWWHWCFYSIQGTVVRPFAGRNVPVCHARVHICEVDPIWLWLQRLPDPLVLQLRDDLIREIAKPLVVPQPHPRPEPDPPPFLARDAERVTPALQGAQYRATGRPPAVTAAATSVRASNSQPLPSLPAIYESLSAKTKVALSTSTVPALRAALTANAELLYPYFCWWRWWWPWWYRCDEIAVIETDDSGRFDAFYAHLCNDKADLYVWVEYKLGGVWTRVYDPGLPCGTYWNYDCATPITIIVDDPRVPGCGDPHDLPGMQVSFMTIGNNISPHQIQPEASLSSGLTTGGSPFGGTLELRVDFGRPALLAAGIDHYRWSYRRLSLSDGTLATDSFHHMSRAVLRHCKVPNAGDPSIASYPAEPMGPDPAFPGDDLFKIQPLVPTTPGAVEWSYVDAHVDLVSAYFETAALSPSDPDAVAGTYELILELFQGNARVELDVPGGVEPSIAVTDAPFGEQTVATAHATGEHLYTEAGHSYGLRAVVHVDNNICRGTIHDASISVNGTTNHSGRCGFLEYPAGAGGTLITVSFDAWHPHNFATFDFTVSRGSSGPGSILTTSGAVGQSAGGYTLVGHTYAISPSVAAILNDPPAIPPDLPCTQGAFAEILHVYATATDGWQQLSYLNGPQSPGEIGLASFAVTATP